VLAGEHLLHLATAPVLFQAGAGDGDVSDLQRTRLLGLDGHLPNHQRQLVVEGVAVADEKHLQWLAGHGLAESGGDEKKGSQKKLSQLNSHRGRSVNVKSDGRGDSDAPV